MTILFGSPTAAIAGDEVRETGLSRNLESPEFELLVPRNLEIDHAGNPSP